MLGKLLAAAGCVSALVATAFFAYNIGYHQGQENGYNDYLLLDKKLSNTQRQLADFSEKTLPNTQRQLADLIEENKRLKSLQVQDQVQRKKAPERWQTKAIWRKLSKEDSPETVIELLGEPDQEEVNSSFKEWTYGPDVHLTFYFSDKKWALSSWKEPK